MAIDRTSDSVSSYAPSFSAADAAPAPDVSSADAAPPSSTEAQTPDVSGSLGADTDSRTGSGQASSLSLDEGSDATRSLDAPSGKGGGAETDTGSEIARAETARDQAKLETVKAETAREQAKAETERAQTKLEQAKTETVREETKREAAKAERVKAETADEQAKTAAAKAETVKDQARAQIAKSEADREVAKAQSLKADAKAQDAKTSNPNAGGPPAAKKSDPNAGGPKAAKGGTPVDHSHIDKYSDDVKAVQKKMQAAGIDPGPIDGLKGPLTRAAMKQYEEKFGKSAAEGSKVDPSWAEKAGSANVTAGGKTRTGGKPRAGGTAPTGGKTPAGSDDRTQVDAKGLATVQGKKMTPGTAADFKRMEEAARRDGVSLTINSAFRDPAYQAKLFEKAVAKYGSVQAARKWVAPPGRSQHQTGKALDLSMGQSNVHSWLQRNAGRFGFTQSYSWEPWHWFHKAS